MDPLLTTPLLRTRRSARSFRTFHFRSIRSFRIARASLRSVAALAATALLALPACQGSELPPEISAISVKNAPDLLSGLFATQMQAHPVSDLPAGSDYHEVQVRKQVEVEVLNQFQILASVFDALRQTHYSENIGRGWYKNLVAFDDAADTGNVTRLQEWYVRSDMVAQGDSFVNRLRGKILSKEPGSAEVELIRTEGHISRSPAVRADGSLENLGVWELRASFEADPAGEPQDFFHATGDVLPDGRSRITIEDRFVEDDGQGGEIEVGTAAILIRGEDSGYGVAEFPDWSACFGPDGQWQCTGPPPQATVRFAYDEHYLTVRKGSDEPLVFDRSAAHELVREYGVFTSEGEKVERQRDFGFPVRVGDRFGWYGAWQDRHELWLEGRAVADGTQVTRDGMRDDGDAPVYTAVRFPGALTRVSLVPGSLEPLRNVASEVHVFQDLRLRWNPDALRWERCHDDGSGGCADPEDFTARLASLVMSGSDDGRHVWIEGCGFENELWVCQPYVYVDDEQQTGFFEAAFDEQAGQLVSTGVFLDTGALPDGLELWVGIDGRAWIEYTGEFDGPTTRTGWVEKRVVDFDPETWTPTFDEEGDREFLFDAGRQYFIQRRGASLRVTRETDTGSPDDYAVFMEIHRVAKPSSDLSEVYPPGTVLEDPYDPEAGSLYRLATDPQSANHLLLVYDTVSEEDAADGIQAGDVVTEDLWGLRVQGDTAPLREAVLYNWEYQSAQEDFGAVTYLMDAEGRFVLVDEALRFEPVALPTADDVLAGRPEADWLTYRLEYDGWLHGLPDAGHELERGALSAEGVDAVLGSNVRVPDGLPLVEAGTGDIYFVRATDVGILLEPAAPGVSGPSLAPAASLDLDTGLPRFEDPRVSATIPADAPLLYVEGVPAG